MVRPVSQPAARLKEATKLGFAGAFVPETGHRAAGDAVMSLTAIGPLIDIVLRIAPNGGARRRPTPVERPE
jgi:predicted ATP-dependent serine protease